MKNRLHPLHACALLFVAACGSAAAGPIGVLGGAGLVGQMPLSGELGEVYSIGPGVALDLHLLFSQSFRLDLGLAPSWASGSPVAGVLATDESATLFYLPAYANFQYALASIPSVRPYAGVGLGLTYVQEKFSFTTAYGDRDPSRSWTDLSWQAMIGVEQNRKGRLFFETWLMGGGTAGVEDVEDTGSSLMSLQLRLGYRVAWR